MPSERFVESVPGFDGGLVIARDPVQLKPNEASILRNAEFGKYSGIRLRPGYRSFANRLDSGHTSSVSGFLPSVYKTPNGNRLLIAFANGKGYYCRLPGNTWTSFVTTLTPQARVGCVVMLGKLYYCDGVTPLRVFDGDALTDAVVPATSGEVPVGDVLAVFKDRLVVTGASDSVVYTSSVAEPDKWDTALDGAIAQIVGARDGTTINGLVVKDGVLKMIKSGGDVYSLDFGNNGVATIIQDGVQLPCASKSAVVTTENDIFTISNEGIYSYGQQQSYFGGARPGEVSAPIAPLFDPSEPNPNYPYHITDVSNAIGCYFRGNILMSVQISGSTIQNWVLVYRTTGGAWCEWTGWNAAGFTYDPDEDVLYIHSSSSNPVYVTDAVYSDNGAAIDFRWRSGKIEVTPGARSTMRDVLLDYVTDQGSSGTLTVFADENETADFTETFPSPATTVTNGHNGNVVGVAILGDEVCGSSEAGTIFEADTEQSRKGMFLKGRFFTTDVRVNQANHPFELLGVKMIVRTRAFQSYKSDNS